MVGFVDRQGNLEDRWVGIIRGIVVNVGWDEVQAAAGGPIVDQNPIDAALGARSSVQRQASRRLPFAIKLRVTAGVHAPSG